MNKDMLGELTSDEIGKLLKRNVIGRIACTDGLEIVILPINYRFDQDSVLCYSLEGHKVDLMRKNNSVCFEVDEITRSNDWKCVVINGIFEEITDERELTDLRPYYTEYMLRKKVSLTALPPIDQEHSVQNQAHSSQVFYRIRFSKVSGRFERPDSDSKN